VTFPRPCRGRIPNFQGAGEAADRLKATDAFKTACVVKVNADKPQETVRVHALEVSIGTEQGAYHLTKNL